MGTRKWFLTGSEQHSPCNTPALQQIFWLFQCCQNTTNNINCTLTYKVPFMLDQTTCYLARWNTVNQLFTVGGLIDGDDTLQ